MQSKLSRRKLLQAGCTIAGATLGSRCHDGVIEDARAQGDPAPKVAPLSQRTVINVQGAGATDYAFINHLKYGANALGPSGNSFTDPTKALWTQLIDADGWPNAEISVQANHGFGGGLSVPDSSNYGGPIVPIASMSWSAGIVTVQTSAPHTYVPGCDVTISDAVPTGYNGTFTARTVLDNTQFTYALDSNPGVATKTGNVGQYYVLAWDGVGDWNTPQANTASFFTVKASLSSGRYLKEGNGRFSGVSPRIVIAYNNTSSDRFSGLISWAIGTTGFRGKNYAKNYRWYRLGDEPDYLAGKVFRKAYLQNLAKLNPSAIRFMGAQGGNNDGQIRFENRMLPTHAGWAADWTRSPPYGVSSGAANQLTLGAVKTGPKQTPATMQHGEQVTFLLGNATVRPAYGGGAAQGRAVTAITRSNPASVTAPSHGFMTGDTCQFYMPFGMTKLHFSIYTVTVLDVNTFTIAIDTTTYPVFDSKGSPRVVQYTSLNVGGRGDYPVTDADGLTAITGYGQTYAANSYFATVFDKTSAGRQDGDGNWVYGAWVANTSQSGLPLEIMTKLINELQAYYDLQGFGGPTHLWLNIGIMAMLSCDAKLAEPADYVDSSNWAMGAANVILNGANGYAGLDRRCNLFVELSNELWNTAGVTAFAQTAMASNKANLRWGTTEGISYMQLRAVYMTEDIKAATKNNPRVKFVMGGFANNSGAKWANSGNKRRVLGTAQFLNDPLNIWGPSVTPISHMDCFAIAPYVTTADGYWSKTGVGGFADDAAMFNGTSPYGKPDQAKAISNFIAQVNIPSGQAGSFYYNSQIADHAAALQALGKSLIQYEGGPDWPLIGQVGGHQITASETAFIAAATDSAAWAMNWISYFSKWAANPGSAMPAILDLVLTRWTFIPRKVPALATRPGNAIDAYDNGVENGAFSPAFLAMCAYNAGKP